MSDLRDSVEPIVAEVLQELLPKLVERAIEEQLPRLVRREIQKQLPAQLAPIENKVRRLSRRA